VEVERLRDGLWRWFCDGRTSIYAELADATCVIDPAVPRDRVDVERFWRALDRDVERRALPVAILLTSSDEQDAELVRSRYRDRLGETERVVELDLGAGRRAYWLPVFAVLVTGGREITVL
jgi:hypothetical protein